MAKVRKHHKKQVSWWHHNLAYKLFAITMLVVLLLPALVRVAQAIH